MNELSNRLTDLEQQTFERLEAAIAENESAAMAYVDDLTQIRDQRLYREKYPTWEIYCSTRWGKSARAITFSIAANKVRHQLADADPSIRKHASETSDRTALALKNMKPKRQKSVLKRAIKIAKGKPITPSHIAQAARPHSQGSTIQNLADTYFLNSTPSKPPKTCPTCNRPL